MIKQYLKFKYGEDFLNNIEKNYPDSLITAKILNDNEIEFTSPYGDGSFTINLIDDKIEGQILIDFSLSSNFIDPNESIKSLIKNYIVEDCLEYCEGFTAECEIVKSMNYQLKLGENFKYKYPLKFNIKDLFTNIITYVSDICIRKNNEISNIKYFLWLLETLQSIQGLDSNLKYNFNVSGLSISDSQILTVVKDNWKPLNNVDSILFEDCVLSLNSPIVLNMFEKGTKIRYKMCDKKLKEFIV